MAYVLKASSEEQKFFVDGLYENTDWTWGTLDEATKFSDIHAVELRMSQHPFRIGEMLSSSITIEKRKT